MRVIFFCNANVLTIAVASRRLQGKVHDAGFCARGLNLRTFHEGDKDSSNARMNPWFCLKQAHSLAGAEGGVLVLGAGS